MTHIVNEVTAYDRKRMKVILDEGEETFLLYVGELKDAGIIRKGPGTKGGDGEPSYCGASNETPGEGTAMILTERQYAHIMDDILLPRAKKRVLYYLKNGDRTEMQIRQKLKEGLYPGNVIERVMEFLYKHRLADDIRYAENFVNEKKKNHSRREIEAKLSAKGIRGETANDILSGLTSEDEYAAAGAVLSKRSSGDAKKDFAYLFRKGFSYEAAEHAVNALGSAGMYKEEM